MTIIHISTDYPDAYQSAKTPAISNLVDVTRDDFDHQIYSLNRNSISAFSGMTKWIGRNWDQGMACHCDEQSISSWTYEAPSQGLFLKSSLHALAEILINDIIAKGIKPTLIQGHKLSMEGIVAYRVAQHFGVPFALSIQGNSDRTILQVRRDLWPLYRKIFHEAAVVFPFSPWALDYVHSVLGHREGCTIMLPCITPQDEIIPPKMCSNQIMSAFHLRHWKIKNLDILSAAGAKSSQTVSDFSLNIYGGGDADLVQMLQDRIGKYSPPVSLCGALDGGQIQNVMNNHAGFAMVSKKESYGMVFAESLLAGCPIIYPQNAAVDGYFDYKSFAQAVAPHDVDAIADAMQKTLYDQKQMKEDLMKWQNSGAAQQFQRGAIARTYRDGLQYAVLNIAEANHAH